MNIETTQLWTGEKPYICIDADGDHLSTPDSILYGCRLSDPRRIRRARFDKWTDKHPRLFGYSCILLMAAGAIGFIALCTLGPRWNTEQKEKDLIKWLPTGEAMASKYGVSKEHYDTYVQTHSYSTNEEGVQNDCDAIREIESDAKENDHSFTDASDWDAADEAEAQNHSDYPGWP